MFAIGDDMNAWDCGTVCLLGDCSWCLTVPGNPFCHSGSVAVLKPSGRDLFEISLFLFVFLSCNSC